MESTKPDLSSKAQCFFSNTTGNKQVDSHIRSFSFPEQISKFSLTKLLLKLRSVLHQDR